MALTKIRQEQGVVINEGSTDVDFRVESNGNANMLFVDGGNDRVGIGDAAPSETLNVAGNIMLEGGDQYIYLTNVGTGNSGIYIRGNTAGSYLRSHSTGKFTWEAAGTERMELSSSGQLKATAGAVSAPTYSFVGDTDTGISRPTTDAVNIVTGGTEHLRVASNGDLTATDTSIASNSDERLKENVADYTYDISKFKQYAPKTFDWKNADAHNGRTGNKGFLAQDIKAIDDNWIGEIDVSENSPDYDIISDNVSLTSKLGDKDAMYISVIQQLIARIEALE